MNTADRRRSGNLTTFDTTHSFGRVPTLKLCR
jgi:hypothetical protein